MPVLRLLFKGSELCSTLALPRYNSRHGELQRKGFTTRRYDEVAYLGIQLVDPSAISLNFFTVGIYLPTNTPRVD